MFHIQTNLDDMQRVIEGLPSDMQSAEHEVQRQIIMIGGDILALMRQPGLPVSYPIQWDSPKQQRAFFATKGFGGGVPYDRHLKYEQAWKELPVQAGVIVENRNPAAHFIGGDLQGKGQSNIHKGRWPMFHDAVATVLARWREGDWEKIRFAFLEGFLKDFRKK